MLPSFILALREGLEAAIVIGIVFSVMSKMDRKKLARTVWTGVASGVLISLGVALVLNRIGMEFEGQGEQIFEGAAMLLAAGILTWMIFWMRSQSSDMRNQIESNVKRSLKNKGMGAIFMLAFLAVIREGIELVLYLLAIRLETNPLQQGLGVLFGLATAALVGVILFTSTRKLSLNRFFSVTNILLILFAAGLVGLGIHEFNELGWIPAGIEHVWNLSGFIADQSTIGQLLRAMVGYNSDPSLSMVIGYFAYFITLAVFVFIEKVSRRTLPKAVIKVD